MKKISNKELRNLIKETVVGPDELLKKPVAVPRKRSRLTRTSLRSLIREELEEQVPLSNRPGGAQFGISYKHVEAMADFDPKHVKSIATEFEKMMLDLFENSPDAFADPKTGDYGPFTGKDSKAKTDRTKANWELQVTRAQEDLEGALNQQVVEFKKVLTKSINEIEDMLHNGDYSD
jgi:hypothetical protein